MSLLLPKTYDAQTTLYLVSPNSSDINFVSGAQQAAKSFALLPHSDPVLLATLQAAGDRSLSPSQLSSMITVENDINSQFVVIKVSAHDPKYAAQLANEITKQSIAQFASASTDGGTSTQFVKQMLGKLEIDINNLEKELADAQNRTPSTSQTARIDQLNTSLSSKLALYNQLLSTYGSISGFQVKILQNAQIPKDPTGLGPAPAVAIGMLAALIVIVAVILFIEQTNGILTPQTESNHNNRPSTDIKIKGTLPQESSRSVQSAVGDSDASNRHGMVQDAKRNDDGLSEDASTVLLTPALSSCCPRCRATLVSQAAFCPRCGSSLTHEAMPATSAADLSANNSA